MTKCEVSKKVITNKSKTYLIPLLNTEVSIEFDYLLSNTFLKFNNHVDIPYPIGLLYEMEDTEAFENYNDYLTHTLLFDKSFIVNMSKKLYIFNFPEQYLNEYKLFKDGKYSKFTSDAKSKIIVYSAEAYKYPPLIEDITGVLWRHKTRKDRMEMDLGITLPQDSELASKIVYEDETFYFKD